MGLTVPPPPKMRHPDSVTCAYCGRRRDASAHECPGCGAQHVAQVGAPSAVILSHSGELSDRSHRRLREAWSRIEPGTLDDLRDASVVVVPEFLEATCLADTDIRIIRVNG